VIVGEADGQEVHWDWGIYSLHLTLCLLNGKPPENAVASDSRRDRAVRHGRN
jgi:hypothetical protein